VWPLLAAGVHVLFEPRARRAVARDGASPDRRGLVGGDSPVLRTYFVAAVSVAGDFVHSSVAALEKDLSLAGLAGHGSSHPCPLAGVHLRRFGGRVGDLLRR